MTNEEVAAIMAARTPGPWRHWTEAAPDAYFVDESFGTKNGGVGGTYNRTGIALDNARAIVTAVNEWDLLEAVRRAADFRASVEFERGWHGADMLDAIAAYMDRKDDEAEAVDGFARDRSVQRDVRRWASGLRDALAALDAHREAQK